MKEIAFYYRLSFSADWLIFKDGRVKLEGSVLLDTIDFAGENALALQIGETSSQCNVWRLVSAFVKGEFMREQLTCVELE